MPFDQQTHAREPHPVGLVLHPQRSFLEKYACSRLHDEFSRTCAATWQAVANPYWSQLYGPPPAPPAFRTVSRPPPVRKRLHARSHV
eukprot:4249160-Pleurochrysis_carterae.AAC.1